jgi:UDP-N-acetyl-D-glucosamine dehydrogenase
MQSTMDITEAETQTKILEMPGQFDEVAVVGMGYVGLPLALRFAEAGLKVTGIDIDSRKVDGLNSGRSHIGHINDERISNLRKKGLFGASSEFSQVSDADAVIMCVPTPLGKNRDPDISYVLETGKSISLHLREGTLVVLESTTFPGTTDELLREVLESGSSMSAGGGFHLAYSPEREDPGNAASCLGNVPKLVGGYTDACLDKAISLYRKAVTDVVPVSSCRVAEAAKLLENIFRSVNIALVNELKMVYEAMGIDIWEVIDAAGTKPFGFMPFYPGPGLGGHCIPIDPFYLTWKAHEYGSSTRFIELAGEINTAMPNHVVKKVSDALNEIHRPMMDSSVLVVGLAYKPNVDDERESPSYRIMDQLKANGARVSYYDPYIPVIGMTREHPQWAGAKSVEWKEVVVSAFDVVVIATAHDCINFQELADWAQCVVDTRNVMAGVELNGCRVIKA